MSVSSSREFLSLVVFLGLATLLVSDRETTELPYLTAKEVADHVYDKCVLLAVPPFTSEALQVLSDVRQVFRNNSNVFVGQLQGNKTDIKWKTSDHSDSTTTTTTTNTLLALYTRVKRDRSCLLIPPKTIFLAEVYTGPVAMDTLIQFLNEKCGTFQLPSGSLTEEGLMHEYIMQNLYRPFKPVEKCLRLKKLPLKLDFFRDYAFRSRPVVIENGVKDWPAMKKWSPEFLRQRYGERKVHVKLTPDGVFEGVERATRWAGYTQISIPESVKSQLPFPDLVVVRPATSEMKFSHFLDFISSGNRTFSAYLEYSSIPYFMPTLQQDIFELPFVAGELDIRQLNMWLSDGNTLGKLHFDPFDNLLCQV